MAVETVDKIFLNSSTRVWRHGICWAIVAAMEGDSDIFNDAAAVQVVAPVSSWFYRRCLLLGVLMVGMGLYFCYDGLVAYPRQNQNADVFDAFQAGKQGREIAASAKPNSPSAAAYRAGADGTSWASHAATLQMAAEPPQRHSEADIAIQKRFALALGLGAVLIGVWALAHRGRCWSMKAEEICSPWGTRFSAKSVTDIDRRRWDRGIALLISNDDARFLKLKLDDYKYQGAGRLIEVIAALYPGARIEPPLEAEKVGDQVPEKSSSEAD